ncbi:MAG: DUF4361 domain-containing protein [Porphyromonadaceae bacterium]|nr:DUF4361 domain-containing protein [Porphyromonadaceae bacterium]
MKLIVKYILTGMFICIFSSCEENLLDQEQYQKKIYLLSSDNNIFKYSHALNDSITKGFITVGSGGTIPLNKDVTVILELDTSSFSEYNRRNFDIEYDKYAKLLEPSRYVLPSHEIVLRAGEIDATTFFPIEIDANGLSPDSTYMVPFKIKSTSDYEVNPEKASVLYQIELKNKYTESGMNTYSMKGTKQPEGGSLSAITTTKVMAPLAKNKVRIFPENFLVSSKLKDIEDKTITITVNNDNTLRLKPFKHVMLEQLEGNRYIENEEIFYLNYRYKLAPDEKWITVTETLKRIK